MFRKLILPLFLLSSPLFGQFSQIPTPEPLYHYPRWAMTKIGAAAWAMGGATVANSFDNTAGFNNPALESSYAQAIRAEFGKHGETTDAFEGWLQIDGQSISPAFIALSSSTRDTQFSIGYARFVSNQNKTTASTFDSLFLDLTVNFQEKLNVHQFFLAGRYELTPLLALGANIGVNYGRYAVGDPNLQEMKSKGRNYNFTLGSTFSPSDVLAFAATYRHVTDIVMESEDMFVSIARGDLDFLLDDSSRISDIGIIPQFQLATQQDIVDFPDVFSLGISHQPAARWNYSLQIDFEHWVGMGEVFKNVLQYHAGASWNPNDRLAVLAGFFTQTDPLKENGKYFDQKFVTAGVRYAINKNIAMTLSMMDSRLIANKQSDESTDRFRQSYLSLGFSVF